MAEFSTDLQLAPIIPFGLSEPVSVSLPAAIRRIIGTLKPERIYLFGSYAHGNPTPDSDVDLLVIMDTDAPNNDRSWEVSRLLLPRSFPVDILVRTPQEMELALKKGDFFIQEILSNGTLLYDRNR